MLVLWIILAVVYIAMLAVLGMQTLTKGHAVLFWVGIFLPFLWIVGAIIPPTRDSLAAASRATR
jgi:hypothetical protein